MIINQKKGLRVSLKVLHKKPATKRLLENFLNATSDTLIPVWTHQTYQVLDTLRSDGVIFGPPEFSMFSSPYTYMCQQMRERMPSYSGRLPIWAWMRGFSQVKDISGWDLSSEREHDEVVIKARVPKSRILASDFNLWHNVLNRGPIHWNDDSDHWNDEQIKQSWSKIFDLSPRSKVERDWYGKLTEVQLCLDGLYLSEIVSVKTLRV